MTTARRFLWPGRWLALMLVEEEDSWETGGYVNCGQVLWYLRLYKLRSILRVNIDVCSARPAAPRHYGASTVPGRRLTLPVEEVTK